MPLKAAMNDAIRGPSSIGENRISRSPIDVTITGRDQMKTRILSLLTAVAVSWWAAVLVAGDQPRKFGPEWTRRGDMYYRTIEVKVSHSPGGNVSGYQVPLENDVVWVHEIDDNRGFTLLHERYGEFKVFKDEQGKVQELSAKLKDNVYFDLDGDGMIDALYDKRGGKRVPMILFEGRLVEVEDSRIGFGIIPNLEKSMWGVGREVWYLFEDGTWKAIDPKVREPGRVLPKKEQSK
jgi:hypothetical protein